MGRRNGWERLALTVLWVAIVTTDAEVNAYEERAVTNGGTISGTVHLEGPVPKPKGYNLTTLPDQVYCGRISDGRGWRLLQPFEVSESGAFQGVIVFLENIEHGKPFSAIPPPRIEAKDCRFLPFINVVRDRHEMVIVNMDPAMHDIQAYETSHLGPRVLFNLPLPISTRYPNAAGLSAHFHKHYEGTPITPTVRMTKGRRVFTMQCGFHAYMESWALVQDHPYYVQTDENGRFELTEVPSGTYRVKIWHPYVHEDVGETVTVSAAAKTEVSLSVPAPAGRLYANQMVENPYNRYKITESEESEILPTLEKQSY